MTIRRDAIETSREGGTADLTATATAAGLYLLLWNQTDQSTVTLTGDADLMGIWRECCRVRWSGGE